MTTAQTSMYYMKSSCMLFVGGLMVAIAIEHSNLHRYSVRSTSVTVCPGSSDPPEKIFNIFASENEGYTIYQLLRYFSLNIIRFQSKTILRSHEFNWIK